MKESIKRSFAKAISWRIIAFVTLLGAVLILGGDLKDAITIGLVDQAIKFFIHYAFERGWNRIKWGYVEETNEENDIELNE